MTTPEADASMEFPTVRAALAYIDHHGWRARHGGGYERGDGATAAVLPNGTGSGVRLVIEARPRPRLRVDLTSKTMR